MAISLQVGLKQSQKLVLTQSLRQAIEMLQMSSLELSEKISNELLENPVLEEESSAGLPTHHEEFQLLSHMNRSLSGDNTVEQRTEEHRERFENASDSGYKSADYENDRKRQFLENAVSHDETLIEHLLWQARLTVETEEELSLFQTIITSLDDKGFFTLEVEAFCTENGFNVENLTQALESITLFDPIGCATSSIEQCLLVQARHYYPEDTVLHTILDSYFLELEKLNYDHIARKLGIALNDVVEKSKLIHNLDPYPARQYTTKETRYIIPDVEVKLFEGEIIISFSEDWIPTIRINNYYTDMLKKKNIEKKQREYIQEKVQAAKFLIKNITGRRETIAKVVKSIMEHQYDFLVKGPGHLKPLTHVNIANEIGMHESTVSRATSNKFIQTSWGVFELKYFFVSRIKASSSSEDQSSDRVKSMLQELIESEDVNNPLKDEEIVNELKKMDISVARRTVAKYRNILNFPAAGKRKKINMMKAEETV